MRKKNINNWTEWWYGNILDKQNNYAAFFSFRVIGNPNDSKSRAYIFFTDFETHTKDINYSVPIAKYSSDTEKCNVSMGKNTFKDTEEGVYKVHIESEDGRTKIDLKYKKIAEGFTTHAQNGFWTVPLASAETLGTIFKEDSIISFSGKGYHDHNWGIFNEDEIYWDWGACYDEESKITLVFGRPILKKKIEGVLFVGKENTTLAIEVHPKVKIIPNMKKSILVSEKIKTREDSINKASITITPIKKYTGRFINIYIARYKGEFITEKGTFLIDTVGFLEYKYPYKLKFIKESSLLAHKYAHKLLGYLGKYAPQKTKVTIRAFLPKKLK
jgi:hypothetical protein